MSGGGPFQSGSQPVSQCMPVDLSYPTQFQGFPGHVLESPVFFAGRQPFRPRRQPSGVLTDTGVAMAILLYNNQDSTFAVFHHWGT